MPLRLKLALQFSVVTLLLLLAVGTLFVLDLRSDLQRSMDSGLRSRADDLIAQLDDATGPDSSGPVGRLRLPSGSYGQVLDSSGRLVLATDDARSGPLLSPAQAAAARQQGEHLFDGELPADQGRGRQQVRILSEPATRPGLVVAVATSREVIDEAAERAAIQLLVLGAIVLLLAGPGAWLLARAALRPVERMRAQAAELEARDAGAGLTVPGGRDEISRLGETLNGLLGRLHEAYEREFAFVADAGHELRTPLTVLRGELELACRPGRTREQLVATVEIAAEQTERLIRLAEDLLVLDRDEREAVRFTEFDLVELAEQARRAAWSAPRSRSVEIVVDAPEAPLPVCGDPDRIRRALDNVLLNALRFAPAGSQVRIAVRVLAGESRLAELEVTDSGPGFAPEFLPVAFERFSRHDAARSRPERDGGGQASTGLGLAIVRSVMRAHSGTATAANSEGGSGARVTLRWPTGTRS
ncbi:sensor histidine kinase [Jatrophihabitans sp.]|uniref:sensor histidine kinase n=1 Tax=Jatrophihabitans sp. TaxID=1932789 RepID=UPI002BB73691|nr:ATP-binding protein [Jatrophihabitans sp.]